MDEYVDIIWNGISRDFTSTLGKFKRGHGRQISEIDAKWLLTLSTGFTVSEAVYDNEGNPIRLFSPIDNSMIAISDEECPMDIGISRDYGFGDMFIAAQFACRNAKLQNQDNHITFYVPLKFVKLFELFPFIDEVKPYPPTFDEQKKYGKYIDLTRVPEFHSNDSRNECRAEIFASIFQRSTFDYEVLELPEENMIGAANHIAAMNTEERKVIALATTSISQIKTYPAPFLKTLIEMLLEDHFIILYGTDDHHWGLKQWNGNNLLSMVDKTPNYIELAAYLAQSDYGIATDSGLMHLLAMLKIPTLALFGNIDPMAMIKYYPTVSALYPRGELPCIPCGNKMNPCPKTDNPFGGGCLNLLDPERVIKTFESSILGIEPDDQNIFRKIMEINTTVVKKKQNIVLGYTPSKVSISEKPKYKVLMVVPHIFMGGGETQLLYLIDALGDYDFKMKVIVMGTIDNDLFPLLVDKVDVEVLGSEDSQIDILRKRISDDEIDIVLFHGTNAVEKALLGLKRKPIVIQILHTGIGAWTEDILAGIARYNDHAIAVAEWIRRKFKVKYPFLNVTAVNNGVPIVDVGDGINLREQLGISEDDFVIGTMSRFGEEKRLQVIIQALPFLPPNVSFLLAGWGKEEESLKKVATEYAPDRVKFAGIIHDRDIFFRSVDVCALVSITEGNSMFLLEAAMARKSIITTAVGSAPDLFKNRESAMFVEGESDSIARAVNAIMKDDYLQNNLGNNARIVIEKFASDLVMANGYRMVFHSEIQRRIYPHHILVFRNGGHGDMMSTIPAVRVLRERFPDATITYATGENYTELLEGLSCIDHILSITNKAFKELSSDYDLAYNFQHFEVWDTHQPIIEHYMELVDAPKTASRELEVNLSNVKKFTVNPPYVCVHTKSNIQCKDWGTDDEWKNIFDFLKEKYTVVQIGGIDEPDYGGIMISRQNIKMKETIEILSSSEFLVGIDSFPIHGAKSVGCKAVVIYGGASHPNFCGYEDNENVVSPSPCKCDLSKTAEIDCTKGLMCLKSITAEDIIGAIKRLERKQ